MTKDELIQMILSIPEEEITHPVESLSDLHKVLVTSSFYPETPCDNLEKIVSETDRFLVIKLGHKKLVEYLIDTYQLEKNTAKKISTPMILSARYLNRFQTLDAYKDYLKSRCVDEKSTFEFLDNFRTESGIFGMYLSKASYVFSTTGLLDIPFINQTVRGMLVWLVGIEDMNYDCYLYLNNLKRKTGLSGYDLSSRIARIEIYA